MEPAHHAPTNLAPPENPDPLLVVGLWAAYVGITPNYARQLIKQRRVATVRIGRKVLLPLSEARRVIAEGTQPATRPVNPSHFGIDVTGAQEGPRGGEHR